MTLDIALTLLILGGAMALVVCNRVRLDVVALLLVFALVLTGLLTPGEAFSGFASPAVIATASVFVISAGLFQTGVARSVGKAIIGLAGESEPRLVGALMIGAALVSAFMNNVASVAVLLPVVLGISRQTRIASSRLLLPLAYAAVMGGSLTLIGTPPNLMISDVLVNGGLAPLGFFEVTKVGLPLTLAGIAFMVTLGRRMIPNRTRRERTSVAALPEELMCIYHLPEHLFALKVPGGSPIVGESLAECQMRNGFGLTVVGVVRDSKCIVAPDPGERLQTGDRMLVEGGPQRVLSAADGWGLGVEDATAFDAQLLLGEDTGLVEVMLAPRSRFEGHTLRETHFRETYGVTVLALWRGAEPIERNLGDVALQMGDILLVQGAWRRIRLMRRDPELIALVEDDEVPRRTKKAPWAIAALLTMSAVVVAGIAPIAVAALGAALLMVVSGCVRVEEVQRVVEWKVIFVIAGMLALGLAMQNSGTTNWIAHNLLSPLGTLGAVPAVAALVVTTAGLNLIMSNYASAAVMGPMALSVVANGALDSRALALAVALSASVAFATPIAHQSNLLVMGPGNCRSEDYVKAGVPLTILSCVIIILGVWAMS